MQNNYIGLHKHLLDTPALVIDKDKLIDNLSRMEQFAKAKKIALRPHAKTHKSSAIAKLQLEYGAVGICVAKVSEAFVMAQAGITGLLITSPVVTKPKIDVLIKVLKLAPDTMIVIDSLENALNLNKILADENITLNVLMDIDSGQMRTGVLFSNAVEVARSINKLSNLIFKGIQCYAGHIQHIKDLTIRATASKHILERAAGIKRQLISEGIDCHIQTGSGTGTFSSDAGIKGVSEIQPGSYVVMDQEYLDIDYKDNPFVPAMTMLTTVISANHPEHVTVDAGTKAMYQVETRPQVIAPDDLEYDWGFGDEHGMITAKLDEQELPKVGDVIELVVGHCDPTINLFDYFYITQNDIVVDRFDINLRGKSQ